ISRMLPGVLANDEAFQNESHYNSLLEYPQYTRPFEWHGKQVPEVLISGHHANIEKWKREFSIERTFKRRPDMFENAQLSKEEKEYLKFLKKQISTEK
ncbi:MAG: tRNA (guanosine(37)-N1)-methyltransferase TrmD, partial [Oscillospiraceae bacterium]